MPRTLANLTLVGLTEDVSECRAASTEALLLLEVKRGQFAEACAAGEVTAIEAARAHVYLAAHRYAMRLEDEAAVVNRWRKVLACEAADLLAEQHAPH